jgi:uncharacterized membrane protein
MAFCANCGAEASGAFCPNCGAPITGPAPGAGASSAPPPPGYVPPVGAPSAAGLSENVASALCYVFGLVSGIIFLVLAPYNQNKTIRFHAFQSIFMHVGIIILFIALSIVSVMLHGLGIFGLGLLSPLIWLASFLLWLYMMWSAYNNKLVVLPVVGELAQKQA